MTGLDVFTPELEPWLHCRLMEPALSPAGSPVAGCSHCLEHWAPCALAGSSCARFSMRPLWAPRTTLGLPASPPLLIPFLICIRVHPLSPPVGSLPCPHIWCEKAGQPVSDEGHVVTPPLKFSVCWCGLAVRSLLGFQSTSCSVMAESSSSVTPSCPQQSAGRCAGLLWGGAWTGVWPLRARGVVEPQVRLRGGWGLGALSAAMELGPWRGGPGGALMPLGHTC